MGRRSRSRLLAYLTAATAALWLPQDVAVTHGLPPPCRAAEAVAEQTPEPDVLTGVVDTLDVVSVRLQLAETVPTFVTVHEIGDRTPRASSVADVLEEGVGVHVRRYGGLGAYSTASIRASSPGQVEIYLDGIPLKSAQWGAVDLSDLALDRLDRVEVYRSGTPVEFGTAGIGGVVNLVTAAGGVARSVASLSAGSHGTVGTDVSCSGDVAGFDYLVSYHHLQSDGDFEYLDRHGTPENADDDAIVVRQNSDFKQSDLLLRVGLPAWKGWRLSVAEEVFWKRCGVPGTESVHTTSVHNTVFRNIARMSTDSPALFDGAMDLRASAFWVYRRDRFFNPEDEVGFSLSDTDNRSWSEGLNAMTTFTSHRLKQRLKLFAESRRDRFVPEDENPAIGLGFTRKRAAVTLSAEDTAFLWDGRLELVGAYRYQEAVDNYAWPVIFGGPPEPLEDPHWSTFHGPAFGARWRPHERITVKANRTRYGRFPSMIELFGASGYVEGNPELEAEVGTTVDVGLAVRSESPGDGLFEAALFWCDRENLIVFLQNSQRTVKAFNLESAHVEGVELTARRALGPSLSLAASYTLQTAVNTGPSPVYAGRRLPYEPEHELFVRTTWMARRLTLWHDYHFESKAYRDRANLPENVSPASHVHGAGVRFELVQDALGVTFEVHNLGDHRVVDVEGYPLPGRTFFLTVDVVAAGA